MSELLGPVSSDVRERGEFAKDFYNKNGELKHISRLNFWSLRDVLREKYKLRPDDSDSLSSFLLPMLYYDSGKRVSAKQALRHPFISDPRTIAACKGHGVETKTVGGTRKDHMGAKISYVTGEAFARVSLETRP